MDAISTYSFASCAWNALQAAPLLLAPQTIITLLLTTTTTTDYPQSTAPAGDVDQYLARSLGLALLALGLITLVPTNNSSILLLTTLHHCATACYAWTRYTNTSTSTRQTGYLLGFLGSAGLAIFGIWCLLFCGGGGDGGGEGEARVSLGLGRRTGTDKRTSGFPFPNSAAYRRKRAR